jgi:NitT/TauT family transport system permease protein
MIMRSATTVRIAVLVAFVLFLEGLCRFGVISPLVLPPPSEIVVALARILASGRFNGAIARTSQNVLLSFLLAAGVGFIAGLVIHPFPRLRTALDPLFASYYAVPVFVFYPLFIALFGLNDIPLIIVGCTFGVVAMTINTLNGLDRIPRVMRKLSKVLNLSRRDHILRVLLPAAAPYFFTGLKLALAYSFLGVIGGEFILSNGGLGFSIATAYESFDSATMYALMLLVLLLATCLNAVFFMWERKLMSRTTRR